MEDPYRYLEISDRSPVRWTDDAVDVICAETRYFDNNLRLTADALLQAVGENHEHAKREPTRPTLVMVLEPNTHVGELSAELRRLTTRGVDWVVREASESTDAVIRRLFGDKPIARVQSRQSARR